MHDDQEGRRRLLVIKQRSITQQYRYYFSHDPTPKLARTFILSQPSGCAALVLPPLLHEVLYWWCAALCILSFGTTGIHQRSVWLLSATILLLLFYLSFSPCFLYSSSNSAAQSTLEINCAEQGVVKTFHVYSVDEPVI